MLNPIVTLTQRYMDVLATRQKLAASNIANADTPGYHTRDVDFASALSSSFGPPSGTEVEGLQTRPDGNNVSLEREARHLAENALKFQIASQFVQNQIRLTRAAIQEGRS